MKIRYVRIDAIYPGDMGFYSNLPKMDLDIITGDKLKKIIREKIAEIARTGEGELVIVPESYAHNGIQF